MQIEIRRLVFEDENEVLDLIRDHFSRDLYSNWLGLEGEDVDFYHSAVTKLKLTQSWSIGVFEKSTKKLIAISVNGIQRSGNVLDTHTDFFSRTEVRCSKHLEHVLTFYKNLESGVFDLLSTDKIFCSGLVAVHKKYRRKGISHVLREKSEFLARAAGCNHIVTVAVKEELCSSFIKQGYKVARELNYVDYYERTNATIFENLRHPYVKAQILYKNI